MTLKKELQSITPHNAKWAFLALLQQTGEESVNQKVQVGKIMDERIENIKASYPGLVEWSDFAVDIVSKIAEADVRTTREIIDIMSKLMMLSLVQTAEMDEQ